MIPLRSYSNMTSPGEGVRVIPIISEKSDNREGLVGRTWFGPTLFQGGEGVKFEYLLDGGI